MLRGFSTVTDDRRRPFGARLNTRITRSDTAPNCWGTKEDLAFGLNCILFVRIHLPRLRLPRHRIGSTVNASSSSKVVHEFQIEGLVIAHKSEYWIVQKTDTEVDGAHSLHCAAW